MECQSFKREELYRENILYVGGITLVHGGIYNVYNICRIWRIQFTFGIPVELNNSFEVNTIVS